MKLFRYVLDPRYRNRPSRPGAGLSGLPLRSLGANTAPYTFSPSDWRRGSWANAAGSYSPWAFPSRAPGSPGISGAKSFPAICDASGKIISGNKAEKEIWGEIRFVDSPDYGEYKGKLPGSDHNLTAREWALARTMENGESVLNEKVDIETFDGERKTILNSTVMVKDEIDRPLGAIIVNQDITSEMNRLREKEELIKGLESAMANIKVLKGLLPICASCKNIRGDDGYWNQIEVYLRENSDLDFSHGICPECAARLYPGLATAP